MPTRLLLLLLLASALAACNEKPQNITMSNQRAQERDQLSRLDAQRQRTIGENEADRVHNEGMLR